MAFAPVLEFPELRLGTTLSPQDPRFADGHHLLRPTWHCRTCVGVWPCGTARLLLNAAYDGWEPELAVFMAGMLYNATRDFVRINRYDAPPPNVLFTRFLSWTHHNRTLVTPPPDVIEHLDLDIQPPEG